MSKYNYKASLQTNRGSLEFNIAIFSFKEDETFIIYTPHLDIYGYGVSDSEALQDFNTSLEEFTKYTLNKGTMLSEMRKLGYTFEGPLLSPTRAIPPSLESLIEKNEEFSKIVESKKFSQVDRRVALAV